MAESTVLQFLPSANIQAASILNRAAGGMLCQFVLSAHEQK